MEGPVEDKKAVEVGEEGPLRLQEGVEVGDEASTNLLKFESKHTKGRLGLRLCVCKGTRAEKSKSLIRWKRLKGGKRRKKAEKANLIYN